MVKTGDFAFLQGPPWRDARDNGVIVRKPRCLDNQVGDVMFEGHASDPAIRRGGPYGAQ